MNGSFFYPSKTRDSDVRGIVALRILKDGSLGILRKGNPGLL